MSLREKTVPTSFEKEGGDSGVDEAVAARMAMKIAQVKIRSRKGWVRDKEKAILCIQRIQRRWSERLGTTIGAGSHLSLR